VQAAIATAEAGIKAADAESDTLIRGAETQAEGLITAAETDAEAINKGASISARTAKEAADVAYSEAYGNVELMKQEADESLRRLDAEQAGYESKTKAKIAASGGELSGSSGAYYHGMVTENQAQYDWLNYAYGNQQAIATANMENEKRANYNYADSLVESGHVRADAKIAGANAVATAMIKGAAIQSAAVQKVATVNAQAVSQTYFGQVPSAKWMKQAHITEKRA
jgi:hypothetical protein